MFPKAAAIKASPQVADVAIVTPGDKLNHALFCPGQDEGGVLHISRYSSGMAMSDKKIQKFQHTVRTYFETHGRHALPWRESHDPYRVLVSEVMLQQTQVERVIPYFTAWLEVFPDVSALAKAPLSKVLRAWQGLGYNRRAKMLHQAAKAVVKEHGGVFPKTPAELEALPGIGPYTARAVCAFSYNQDVYFVETNIRTVILHHFFSGKSPTIYGRISDAEILAVVEKTLPKGKAREWYAALMDYGSHLKRSGIRLNERTKGYAKQKKFQGSDREARGAVLRALVLGAKKADLIIDLFGPARRAQMRTVVASLTKEGMITLKNCTFRLPR